MRRDVPFFCINNEEDGQAKASLEILLSEKLPLTSLFSSLSGRKVILCPLIIDAGEKSLAAIVSCE